MTPSTEAFIDNEARQVRGYYVLFTEWLLLFIIRALPGTEELVRKNEEFDLKWAF